MNKTSTVYCQFDTIHASYLTYSQLAVLTVINLIVMVGNVTTNSLVIFVLIKTKQFNNVASKLIFMLCISDLLLGAVGQNFYFVVLYDTNCLMKLMTRVFSIFFLNLSSYTIAIMGVDRFVRIKFYKKVRVILTTRFMAIAVSIACSAALINAVMNVIGALLRIEQIYTRINFVIGAIIISIVAFLQLLVMRASNLVHMQSNIDAAQATNRKITKLSMRIMLLVLFFHAPLIIVNSIRNKFQDQLNKNGKSILEFIACVSLIITYTNSLVNAILFLIMNVKAKRFLRDFLRK